MALPDFEELKRQLEERGYVILPEFIDPATLAELREATDRQFELEGERAGAEFRQEPGSARLANLVNKGEVYRRLFTDPRLLSLVEVVLGREFKLSSLNARYARPHNAVTQPLHADMGAVPDEHGFWVCNSVWLLDDFTSENGPLRAIPGSHRWGKLPQDELPDPIATHPDEELLTAPAGSVFVMNAHVWHGGLANQTDRLRRAVHVFFARRDKPQQQHQKELLDADVQASLTPLQRRILALDDPLNDQVTLACTQRSGFLK